MTLSSWNPVVWGLARGVFPKWLIGCTKEVGIEHPIPGPAILHEGPGPTKFPIYLLGRPGWTLGPHGDPNTALPARELGLLSTQDVSPLKQQHGTIYGILQPVAEVTIPRYLRDPFPSFL